MRHHASLAIHDQVKLKTCKILLLFLGRDYLEAKKGNNVTDPQQNLAWINLELLQTKRGNTISS